MRAALKFTAALLLLLVMNVSRGQNTTTAVKTVLTADSLASGNLKDVLSSFFQLAFNNLTGKSKEFNFSSNPYALLLKSDPSAALDVNYYKYRALRKLNFGFGLKLDSAYHFNGFSSGLKYALINQRDTTTSQLLFQQLGSDPFSLEVNILQDKLNEYMDSAFGNNVEKKLAFNDQVNLLLSDDTKSFSQLDPDFQKVVKDIARQNNLVNFTKLITADPNKANIRKESQAYFSQLKKDLQQKLLWTVSLSDTTYKDQFVFSNILLKTELLKGFGKMKPGSNWEFNIVATMNFIDDTLNKGRDLKRAIFRFEPAINLVVRSKGSEQSFLEFRFSGEYRHTFNTLYAKEERDALMFNGVLRVRMINDIWLPLEFKYDPENGNLFGFLSAKVNFSTLKKFISK